MGLIHLGCGDNDDAPGAGPPVPTALLGNGNNYTSTASLAAVPTKEVQSSADTQICWQGLSTNLQCHDIEPDVSVRSLSFLRFDMTVDEVKERLVGASLGSADIEGALITHQTGGERTCMRLGDFETLDGPIDVDQHFVEGDELTYLVVVSSREALPPKALSMLFLEPSSSAPSRVDVDEGCGLLEFSAEIDQRTPLSIPGEGPWIVDWSPLTLDGQEQPFVWRDVDKLLVGFYPDVTPSQIEEAIFDLEDSADPLWELAIGNTRSADLADARMREAGGLGSRFDGFNRGEGTWVLALLCESCSNPQPLALTVLEPAGN